MQKGDKASQSIVLGGRALLLKMLKTLKLHGIFGSNFVYLCILSLSSHWYEKGEEASPSIILASRALLVKMLVSLEPRRAFGSTFEYLRTCISTLSSHWYAKR